MDAPQGLAKAARPRYLNRKRIRGREYWYAQVKVPAPLVQVLGRRVIQRYLAPTLTEAIAKRDGTVAAIRAMLARVRREQ